MDENYHYQPVNKAAKPSQSRPSRQAGEIVEVQGGHIVRSTGLKDRHSKVCTAKGPRDRRVRLSAHTAIQFYDVQDRLGYDRPSKAVDWLIKKAKASIDELAELPPWTPTNLAPINQNPDQDNNNIDNNQMGCSQNSRFLPESLDSVKSFFPVNNNNINNNNQDLKLSLQSIQDPITQHQPGNNINNNNNNNNNNNIYFDGSENGGFGFGFGLMANSNAPAMFGQPTNNQLLNYISQRGPLQSSNSPPVRAWVDPLPFVGAGVYPSHQTLGFNNPFPVPGFGSGVGGFSGFDVPARIPGEEEERDGLSDKPSSGSSDSRH